MYETDTDLRMHEVERVCALIPDVSAKLLKGLAQHAIQSTDTYLTAAQIYDVYHPPEEKREDNRSRIRIHRLEAALEEPNRTAQWFRLKIEHPPRQGYRLRFVPVSRRVQVPHVFRTFWGPILSSGRILVVYSNNEFNQRRDGSLIETELESPSKSGPDIVELTGVGEVMSIVSLIAMSKMWNVDFTVKRALLAGAAELAESNVIYVGSPFTNQRLRQMLVSIWHDQQRRYAFRVIDGPPHLSIWDNKKKETLVRHSLDAQGTWLDYALVCRLTKNEGKTDVILAGTSTFGTQAAVKYVCGDEGNVQLSKALPQSYYPCVEAILHVKVANGEPVETTLERNSVSKQLRSAAHRAG